MNKRQSKKARKKVIHLLVDEMNLLTLSEEECKAAMEDFEKFEQKHCRYKHYKYKYKNSGFGTYRFRIYRFPVGKEYARNQ